VIPTEFFSDDTIISSISPRTIAKIRDYRNKYNKTQERGDMDSDIQVATLVESDDELKSDMSSKGTKSKKEMTRERRPFDEVQDAEEVTSKQDEVEWEEKGAEEGEGEKDMTSHPGADERHGAIKKAKIMNKKGSQNRGSLPFSLSFGKGDQNTLLVIGVVIIIILSAVIYTMQSGDDSDVVVNVPELMIGDEGIYTVTGDIDIRDAESDPIGGEITEGKIDLKGSSMTVKAESITTVTDGYFREYSALKTYSLATWNIDGWVNTESYDVIDIDGDITISSDSYRNGNTVLLTKIDASTKIDARSRTLGIYTKDIDSEDHLRTYSSDSGDLQASLDEIIHTKDLKKGMNGEFSNDDVDYDWKVTGTNKVYGAKCVIVEFTVKKPLPEELESQSIKLYLSSKYPIPVKTVLKLVITAQGRATVKYTMTMNRFTRGQELLPIPSDEIDRSSPYREQRFMDIYPPTGTKENSSIAYELKDAHDKAVEESGLKDYLDDHSDAYLVQGIYNETDGPVWNLTYSYPDSETGYVVIVTESKVDDKGEMKLDDAGSALEVNVPAPELVNSWAGAEQVLKQDSEVKDTCFNGEGINLHDCNLGVRTRLYQPSFDLISMFASAPRVDYGYVITQDDDFAAGVSADTGQLLFVGTHNGPDLTFS